MHVLFYICVGTDFVDWTWERAYMMKRDLKDWTWERVYMMKRDLKCALLMTDCDRIILSLGVRPVFKLQNT